MKQNSSNRFGWLVAIVALVVVASFSASAFATEPSYNGHYELVDTKAKREFSLDVKQSGSRADISFSAAMEDGTGAAPDGVGKGRVEDGVLSFRFKDSFNNEGTCTLQSGKAGFELSMIVLKVVNPGPFHFYGDIALKKTSEQADGDVTKSHSQKSVATDALPQ